MKLQEFFLSWGMLALSILFNAIGVFIIKIKLNELGPARLTPPRALVEYFLLLVKSKPVMAGVALFVVAPFLFAIALSRMEISVAYPLQVVLNFLFLIILAIMFLGETITLNKAIAIGLGILSIYFLYKK